jgi:response regulator RpfG family c-di-GMP phosphodiesterase
MRAATQKQDVKVLVADDESFMREIIVNALSASGYREIRSVFRLAQLAEVIASNYPDLLIINGEMDDGDAVELVRKMRMFRLGRNPFVPVIMTSWHSDGEFVQRVVDGGIDVLVTKPFAAGQLFARINFLVNARPPFVATADYIGPDRRKSKRGSSKAQFEVPNSLQERLDGKVFDPEDLGARISKTFSAMRQQRKRMQEAAIGRLYSELTAAVEAEKPAEARASIVESLSRIASFYAEELPSSATNDSAARAFAAMLTKVAADEGDCAKADCERMFEHIGKMGIDISGEPDVMIGEDANDVFIQADAAA